MKKELKDLAIKNHRTMAGQALALIDDGLARFRSEAGLRSLAAREAAE